MRCLICGSQLNGCLCPRCGFDLSQCREQYPTLANDYRRTASVWTVRDNYLEAQPPVPPPAPAPAPKPAAGKKGLVWIIAAVLVLAACAAVFLFTGGAGGSASATENLNAGTTQAAGTEAPSNRNIDWKVAVITDIYDVTDQGYNQACYEGVLDWCTVNNVAYTWYRPAEDNDASRVAAIDQAVADGYSVLVMAGYTFPQAIVETVERYPEVIFLALDMSEWDLQAAKGTDNDFSWQYPANLYASTYRVAQAGYLAGYAAVKLGYTKLGFLGGMPVPDVNRYGYGFVQGANDAALELDAADEVEIRYIYGNQFYGDDRITACMDSWYSQGTELVFCCGGSIYTSAAKAALKVGGKVIGADTDQSPTIDGLYGEGLTVTSAMKGLSATVKALLTRIADGSFRGGIVENLGIVSENPEENYVQLAPSTQWDSARFSQSDYKALVSELLRGERTVYDTADEPPAADISVDYAGYVE